MKQPSQHKIEYIGPDYRIILIGGGIIAGLIALVISFALEGCAVVAWWVFVPGEAI